MNHQFTVIIDLAPNGNDEILNVADALGNAGCLDASIGGHADGMEAVFNREANSLMSICPTIVSASSANRPESLRSEASNPAKCGPG